jgi:3-carboxy-cis,cis-muconate cycloisomerase
MTVDTARMRANLDLTGGLIMAEAVATALVTSVGNAEAHQLVERACAAAIEVKRPLIEVLADDPDVSAHVGRAELEGLFRPESYTGESAAVVDRVLARYATLS